MNNGNLPASTSDENEPSRSVRSAGQPEPTAGGDASLDFSSIFATLWREKWIVLLTAVVVTGLIGGYTYTQPSVYQASSLVRIGSQSGGVAQVTGSIAGEGAVRQAHSLPGEVGVLQNSIELATRVADALRTHEDATTGDGFPVLLEGGNNSEAVGRKILEKVEFTPRPERDLIEIVVESRSSEEAAAIANLYAREYRRYSQEEARSSVQAAQNFLKTQSEQQRQKIDSLESEWEAFVRENRLIERGQRGENVTSKFNELKARRDEVAFELEKQKTQLKLLRRQLRQFQPNVEQNVLEEQEASGLRTEIGAMEEKIADMRARAATYYAANPKLEGDSARIQRDFPELARLLDQMEALENRKRTLTRQLVDEVSSSGATAAGGSPIDRAGDLKRQITEKQLTIEQLRAQRSALESQIASYESKLGNIPEQRIRREQIQRKLKQAEGFYETIMTKLQQINVAEESELGYVQVVKSAFVPSVPIRPEVGMNLILGILLGFAFGVGLAFLREATNTRLRSPEDIENKGYSLLGVVPDMDVEVEKRYDGRDFVEVEGRTISTRLAPLLNPWSPVTENYRLIRANLGRNGTSAQSLLVTSAQEGEGKTLTAVNLALTEALGGRRTLLIDADMRKPTAHEMLDMPRTPGLAGMLDGTPEAKCWKTLVDGLCFIPAGVAERGPANILDSNRIRELLEEMRDHFEVIVLDTPPTQAASDAIVIGTQTDVRTLVVSAAERDARALDSVMESLQTARIPVAGVVLNQFDNRSKLYGNYESSYYGHDDEYVDYRLAAASESVSG